LTATYKEPSVAQCACALAIGTLAVTGSIAFGTAAAPPGARGWMALALVGAAFPSLAGGWLLIKWGTRWIQAGNQPRAMGRWSALLASTGSIVGVCVAASFARLAAYWVFSTLFFAFVCGIALRAMQYLLERRRSG
jgi:hypothetical protein